MKRNPRLLLWDAKQSADAILRFTAGRSLEQYATDDLLRPAVERHFEIIGEALNRLKSVDAALAGRISDLRRAVAFRNVLIHGYESVDDPIVWSIIKDKLPSLAADITALLDELAEKG